MENRPRVAANRSVAVLTSTVYFVQGAIGISAVAFPLFLRQRGWGISEIATFSFLSGLPWTLKLAYGALSDGLPLGGLRRKPYILLASFLSFLAWTGLSFLPERKAALFGLVLLENLGFAFTDVVTDALIVENSNESSSSYYQTLAWGYRSLGAVLGGFGGGWLAQYAPYRLIFMASALLPLVTLGIGLLIRETPRVERVGDRPHLLQPILDSFRALVKGDLKWFSLFMLVSSSSAAFGTPFFFFLKEKLLFRETFLGTLSSITWLGAVLGCVLYGRWMREMTLKRTLLISVVFNLISTISSFGVLNAWSAATLFFVGGVLTYLSLLPLMATAAFLSRKQGIEGSLFALLMSVFNLGQILSAFIGGKLFDIIGLHPLIFLSAVSGLTGFFFIRRLKLDTV